MNSPFPGLGASRPRFRDSAAPPGIDLFLLSAYCELTISGPGRLQAFIYIYIYIYTVGDCRLIRAIYWCAATRAVRIPWCASRFCKTLNLMIVPSHWRQCDLSNIACFHAGPKIVPDNTKFPGIDLLLVIAYCELTISGPGRLQAQIPGFRRPSWNRPFHIKCLS